MKLREREREREREKRERESGMERVCEREREERERERRERESGMERVCVRERQRECVCVCVCVCERGREGGRERVHMCVCVRACVYMCVSHVWKKRGGTFLAFKLQFITCSSRGFRFSPPGGWTRCHVRSGRRGACASTRLASVCRLATRSPAIPETTRVRRATWREPATRMSGSSFPVSTQNILKIYSRRVYLCVCVCVKGEAWGHAYRDTRHSHRGGVCVCVCECVCVCGGAWGHAY